MTRLLITAATALALSVTIASAQTKNIRHSNARPLYDQVMTASYGPLPMILGVAY